MKSFGIRSYFNVSFRRSLESKLPPKLCPDTGVLGWGMTSYEINSNLHLVSLARPRTAAKPQPQPTNQIVVIDCSGSMAYDLPRIREQLKGKLPKLLGEQDTVSIVWFSGRGEYGTLVKGEPVATLKDLSDLNRAIDRWLKPICFTGFKEPLEEASKLVDELGGVCSLFFMSDGYDNQWSRQQILEAVRSLAPKCAATTFVEYGYYCNHPLMVEMAEVAGGTLVFNEDFKAYEPNFEAAMQKRAIGVKRLEVALEGEAVRGFAFAFDAGNLMTFKVDGGKVQIPEHVDQVWYLSPSAVGDSSKDIRGVVGAVYAAISLYAQRVDSEVVLPLLKTTGDVRFIREYGGCFGKQKYAAFTQSALEAAFDESSRLKDGYDPSAVPDDNAFTVLDLLRILNEDGDNRLLLESKDFKYNKIGRPQKQKPVLTAAQQKKVDELEEAKIGCPDEDILRDLESKIEKIRGEAQPLRFEADLIPNGVTIDNLVFNETRPNVSVQVRRTGKVNLKKHKPKGLNVPNEIRTFTYRNYTIIRDGLVNVDKLPLRLTKGTVRALLEAGLPESAIWGFEGEDREKVITRMKKASNEREINLTLDLTSLPILNRAMVKAVSAKELFETQYKLLRARAAQKVFNAVYKDQFGAEASDGYKVLYGEDAATWLKDQGLTDYSGFNPKSTQTEAKDSYMGKELKVSLKGLSTLPSLSDFHKRVSSKKPLLAGHMLLKPTVDHVTEFLGSDVYKKAKNQEAVFKAWLDGEKKDATKTVRQLLYKVSQVCFSVVVGQTWFTEFDSLDENSLDIDAGLGKPVKASVEMREIPVAI